MSVELSNFYSPLNIDSDDDMSGFIVYTKKSKSKSKKTSLEKIPPVKTSPEKTSPEKTSPEKTSPEKISYGKNNTVTKDIDNIKKFKNDQLKMEKFLKLNDLRSKIYSGLKFDTNGILDEYSDLPMSIDDAYNSKRNLTLKQIVIIMNLHGLWGEMYNVIHDHIQKKIRRHQIKITHQSRVFYVSLYNWYDMKKIESMINSMLGDE